MEHTAAHITPRGSVFDKSKGRHWGIISKKQSEEELSNEELKTKHETRNETHLVESRLCEQGVDNE